MKEDMKAMDKNSAIVAQKIEVKRKTIMDESVRVSNSNANNI